MLGYGGCLVFVLVLSNVAVPNEGARILALFATPSRSHVISYQALTRELAARGHEIVVMSSFPQEKPLANYTDIVLPTLDLMSRLNMFEVTMLDMMRTMITMIGEVCESYLSDPSVQDMIHSKGEHFDLILYGMMFSDCFLGFAHKFQAPIIGMLPNGGAHMMLATLGNPNPYAYVPSDFLTSTSHMNFQQRLANTMSITLSSLAKSLVMTPNFDKVMRKHFSEYEPIPYIADLEKDISLLLLNSHWSITKNPRPYVPNIIDVGGMHITAGKELPKDLKKFLDDAKDGAVYFSMGSNLKASNMTEEIREAFVAAFSKIKQRVLWKADMDSIPGLSSNVKIGKWMPQISILGHPNVKVFITHGGLLSTQEAIYQGKPVIGIPIFADQDMNMYRAEQAGYGLTLKYKNVTTESLHWAMEEVIGQQSYATNARAMSEVFRDQPSTALEQAVFWTEYVIRHKGARHLRSPSLDLAWYQYFLLDVIAFMALALLAVVAALYWAVQTLKRVVCSADPSKKKVE